MKTGFICEKPIGDEISRRISDDMLSTATKISVIPDIDRFSETGSLPLMFFDLLEQYYQQYDQYIARQLELIALPIRCSKNCARCCHQPVRGLYSLEIVNIYRLMRDDPEYPTIHNRFNEMAAEFRDEVVKFIGTDEREISNKHPAIDAAHKILAKRAEPCPLLKDRLCRIYQNRPVSCRMFYGISEPSLCTSDSAKTFAVEPPEEADKLMFAISDKLNVRQSELLAQGLVFLGCDRKFKKWKYTDSE